MGAACSTQERDTFIQHCGWKTCREETIWKPCFVHGKITLEWITVK